MNNPHDALFKATFSTPAEAAGELRCVLPAALVARVEWSSLELVAGTFVDDMLRDRHSDLLFSAKLVDGGAVAIYVLFEHQSGSDPLMPYRLLRYMVRIWDRWLTKQRQELGHEPRRLPAIVPVVLHHGDTPWRAPIAMTELIDAEDFVLAAIREYVPEFRFVLDDLCTVTDEELRVRATTALGRLVLFVLKHTRTRDDLLERLRSWAGTVREVVGAPHGVAAFAMVMRYIVTVSRWVTKEAITSFALEAAGDAGREAVVTLGEQLIEQGRKEGHKKGREEGLLEGQRRLLRRQLETRFGPLPAEAVARIERAPIDALERWADRILTADTIDRVLS